VAVTPLHERFAAGQLELLEALRKCRLAVPLRVAGGMDRLILDIGPEIPQIVK
jgi:hypothetical protein